MDVKDLFDLTGKVAIVTGGGRGLGLEITEGLAEAGAKVTISGRRRQWLDPAAEALCRRGFEALAVEADVSSPDDVRRTVDATVERFGGVDILVNNAGLTWGAPSLEYPFDKWQLQIAVNLTGTWLMAQAVARHMIARGGGRIVNVSSIAGQVGMDPEMQDTVAYNASKGGVEALTRDLAVKWARYNILVNAVAPGYFPTRMTEGLLRTVEDRMTALSPLGRIGREGELKGAVVFLCSPAASFITGQVLNVDGGSTIR
jgi:NAD(P)-dependent dehydrogenase (short-subunit alcohol dehydrogenase family)